MLSVPDFASLKDGQHVGFLIKKSTNLADDLLIRRGFSGLAVCRLNRFLPDPTHHRLDLRHDQIGRGVLHHVADAWQYD